jgi:predicted nucleic acid-binding protein
MILLAPDVVLDVLLARAPHAEAAARLLDRAVRGEIEALVAADTVALAWRVADQVADATAARGVVEQLLALVPVAPLDGSVLLAALASPLADPEAALLVATAQAGRATVIASRHAAAFAGGAVPVQAPAALLRPG